MLGDTPLLIEQPEFVDLQLNLKSVQSDIGQLQSGLQIGNEKTEALKKEITLIEGELEENKDVSRSHQDRVKNKIAILWNCDLLNFDSGKLWR